MAPDVGAACVSRNKSAATYLLTRLSCAVGTKMKTHSTDGSFEEVAGCRPGKLFQAGEGEVGGGGGAPCC